MVKDLGKLQEELKKTTVSVEKLGTTYTKLLGEYDKEKEKLSEGERDARETAIKEAKDEFNLKKKYAEDLFTTLKEINRKQHAEEMLGNKESVEQSKAAGEEELKNRLENHKKNQAAEAEFGKTIEASTKSINKKEIKKAAKDEKYKKKWEKIAKDTTEYTNAVNGALTNMFGATTKYMEKKKEMMQAELAEIAH